MSLILLVLCVLAASFSAYVLAMRLFPTSRLDTIALATTLFLSILIIATLSAGFLSLFQLIPLTLFVFLFSALAWWVSRRVKPIEPVLFLNTPFLRPTGVIASVIWISAWLVSITTTLLLIALYAYQSHRYMLTNGDVMWIYMPNVLNFVQSHSVWDFRGLWSYFSFSYELLFGWGVIYTQSYALLGWIHLLPTIGIVCYILCIFNLILKDANDYFRFIGSVILIPFILYLNLIRHVSFDFGKNDHFILFALLMGIYYLMCYWNNREQADNRYLLLVGVACGLLIAVKYTGVYWVTLLAAAHLFAFLRYNRRQLFTLGIRHFIYVLIPILILAGPWLLRTLSASGIIIEDAYTVDLSFNNRIIQLYHVPIMMSTVDMWLPGLVIGLIGLLLTLASRRRWIQALGVIALSYGITQIYMQSNFFILYIGPYYTSIILLAVILIFARWRRQLLPDNMLAVNAIALTMLIVLAFMPFSAWTEGNNFVDPDYMQISFRYAPAIIPLLIIVIVALFIRLWMNNTPVIGTQPDTFKALSKLKLNGIGVIFVSLLIGSLLLRVATFRQSDTWLQYDNWEDKFERPTELYRWINQTLSNTSIFAMNIPFTTLYGRDFNNRVYVFQEAFVLGEQYLFDHLTSYIDENRIAYIVVNFPLENDIYFRNVLDTPQFRAEVERMRREYEVVFEDEQAVVFATSYSEQSVSQ